VGGSVGGIAGALVGIGIREYEAKRYEGLALCRLRFLRRAGGRSRRYLSQESLPEGHGSIRCGIFLRPLLDLPDRCKPVAGIA